MNTSKKTIITLLGIITAAFALYYLYTQLASFSVSSTSEADLQLILSRTEVFINRGRELDQMNLDVSLFEDTHFRSLRSFTGPVVEQVPGRSDPFAPAQSSISL